MAATKTWDFGSSLDYDFDDVKIEVTSGQAQLKAAGSPTWYNASWTKRAPVTIDNTGNASTLTDYEVQVDVVYDSDMQADFDDIRFTDDDGTTLLSHWIETYTASTAATFWVNIPSIPASSNKTIYVYYGNSAAISASDIQTAFLLGDDFESFNAATEFGTPRFAIDSTKIGNDIYVSSFNSTSTEDFLHKSTDDGVTWAYVSSPWAAASSRTHPYIDSDGVTNLYVTTINSTKTAIYFKKSTDSGATWGGEVTIATGLTDAVDGDLLYVSPTSLLVAVSVTDGANDDIRIYESTDDGDSWGLKNTAVDNSAIPIEDIELFQLQNGDILLGYEKETTEKEEAGVFQKRSTDSGVSWGVETTVYDAVGFDDEGGTYAQLGDGTLWFFFGTDEDTGVSYDQNVIKRLVSADDGASWGSKTTVYDSYSNVEPTGELDSSENFQLFVTKHYDGSYAGDATFQMVAVQAGGTQLSDRNWDQRGGLAYTVWDTAEMLNKVMRVDGESRTSTRAFISNTYSGSNYIVETKIKPDNTNEDARFAVRYTDTFNHYLINLVGGATNKIFFYKRVDNTYTELSQAAVTIDANTWYDVRVVLNGTSIKTYVDGVLKNNFTDGTYASGKISLAAHSIQNSIPVYFDDFRVRSFTATEPTASFGAEEQIYASDDPTIAPTAGNAQAFTSLSGFSETATKNGGEIKYQISNDTGATWYWYSGGWTATVSGYVEANTAADVNTNIASFPVGGGSFLFKAYLHSDGTQLVQLDSVDLTYVNNTAPDSPASLGGHVSGTYTSDTTPTLIFTLSDPNGGDTVQYQIQIDDSVGFGSAVVDYTSALGAQDDYSFTVGQAEGGGAYTAGTEGQTLADGDYYWKVRAIDNSAAESGYATANGGAVAFRVDATVPTDPADLDSPSHTVSTWSNDATVDLTWSAGTDTASGVDGYSYLWNTAADTVPDQTKDIEESVTSLTSPALADGASHYFHLRTADNAGNWTATLHLGPFWIDATDPTDPTNLASSSHTVSTWSSDNTVDLSWTAATDATSGVDGYSYLWDTSADTVPDDTKEAEESLTSLTSPALTDGNAHYFHLHTVDNAGNWTATLHLGPFWIDTTAPTDPGAPSTTSPTTDTTPTWSWTTSTDATSGLRAAETYEVQWSQSATFSTGVSSAFTTTVSFNHSTALALGTWYFRVRSFDTADNPSGFSATGTVLIEAPAEEPAPDPEPEPEPEPEPIEEPEEEPAPEPEPEPEPAPEDDLFPAEETPELGSTVTLRLADQEGNPLVGIPVTLASEPRTTTTNNNGEVTFNNVLPGEHTISFEYGGEKIERQITVLGDEPDYRIDIKVEGVAPEGYTLVPQWTLWVLGIVLSGAFGFLWWRSKRRADFR